VALRGGGDLGSGVAYRLYRAGFPLLITELALPLLVRRTVAFGSAVIEGSINVEGITARRVDTPAEVPAVQARGEIPVLIDPEGKYLPGYAPHVLIDARMRKMEPGPCPAEVLLVIGLGPGFEAPRNCHAVIETNRGHRLGRVITQGTPESNTGIPGSMQGQTASRVLRAPAAGTIEALEAIGTRLTEGQAVARIGPHVIRAPFDGVLRGLLHEGVPVELGDKIGDVDPRAEPAYCFTISEKSLAIGGGVLEAVLSSEPIRKLL